MSVIPNKYLATNVNKTLSGPNALLRANNIRIYTGAIRPRNGQDYLPQNDLPLQYLGGSLYRNYRIIKMFWYNNRPWAYFRSNTNSQDGIGYYDFTSGQWRAQIFTSNNSIDTNVDNTLYPPQLKEANNRLLFLSKNGLKTSAKLDTDVVNSNNNSYQTNLVPGGCPRALAPDTLAEVNTSGTYNQNWLPSNASVAYRCVWRKINENGVDIYGPVSARVKFTNTNAAARAVSMAFVLPVEFASLQTDELAKYTLEIYRTKEATRNAAGITPDPGDEMYMVAEIRPTSSEISAGLISSFTDIISSAALQDPLYTNSLMEGIQTSRERPPIARTVDYWKNCAFYGNTTSRWLLMFEILSVLDSGAVAGSETGLRPDDVLIAGEWAQEAKTSPSLPHQFDIDTTSGLASQLSRITLTTADFIKVYNRNTGRFAFELHNESGPDDFTGRILMEETVDNAAAGSALGSSWKPYVGLYRANGWPSSGDPSPISPNPLVKAGKGKGYIVTAINCAGGGAPITLTVSGTPDFAVGDTINLANLRGSPAFFVASNQYVVSSVSGSDIQLTGITSGSVIAEVAGAGSWAGYALLCALHCVKSAADQLESPAVGEQIRKPNRVMFSPFGEPESCPFAYTLDIGSSDAEVMKLMALGDSLFVFKSDGLFRIFGDYPDFDFELFDRNVVAIAPDAICSMGGSLYALTSTGIYRIGEDGAERISFEIQNLIDPIVTNNISNTRKLAHAVANEADKTVSFWVPNYAISTATASTQCDICFVYDSSGWTVRNDEALASCAGIRYDSADVYSIYTSKNLEGWVTRERRTGTALDYCDENIFATASTAVTIVDNSNINVNIGGSAKYATLGSSFTNRFLYGVVTINNDFLKRAYITAASRISDNNFRLTLEFANPAYNTSYWMLAGNINIYLAFESNWQWNVFDSEDPDRTKHFGEASVYFDQPYFSNFDVGFASDINPTEAYQTSNMRGFSITTDPRYWPLLQEDTTLSQKTIKTLVGTSFARCSKLRMSMRHTRAMEFFSVYGYSIKNISGGTNIERTNG